MEEKYEHNEARNRGHKKDPDGTSRDDKVQDKKIHHMELTVD